MYAIATLLFLVARKASRDHKLKLTYHSSSIVAQLLKLFTICKLPLHRQRNYVDQT